MLQTKEEENFDELMSRFQDSESPDTVWAMGRLNITMYDDFSKLMNAWMNPPMDQYDFKTRLCNVHHKYIYGISTEVNFIKSIPELGLKEEQWIPFYLEMFHRVRKHSIAQEIQPTQEEQQLQPTQDKQLMPPMYQMPPQIIVTKEEKYDKLMHQFQDNASPETNWAMCRLQITNYDEFTELMKAWMTPSSTLPELKIRVCSENNMFNENDFIKTIPNLKQEQWIPFFIEMSHRVREPPTPQEFQEKMHQHMQQQMQQMQQMQQPQ